MIWGYHFFGKHPSSQNRFLRLFCVFANTLHPDPQGQKKHFADIFGPVNPLELSRACRFPQKKIPSQVFKIIFEVAFGLPSASARDPKWRVFSVRPFQEFQVTSIYLMSSGHGWKKAGTVGGGFFPILVILTAYMGQKMIQLSTSKSFKPPLIVQPCSYGQFIVNPILGRIPLLNYSAEVARPWKIAQMFIFIHSVFLQRWAPDPVINRVSYNPYKWPYK